MTRPGPDFLLIGAMKAGTTSLFDYICQHPRILPPEQKELHYYDRTIYDGDTLDDYLRRFPSKAEDQLSGEATPYYLRHPHCPAWIKRDFPDVRLMAILRNPTDRAYSHYNQRFTKGKEHRDFQQIIAEEDDAVRAEWQAVCDDPELAPRVSKQNSYLSRSRYAEQLEAWFECFPREQMLVLFSEELSAQPEQEMKRVFDHLGIDSVSVDTAQRRNVRKYDPMPAETRALLDSYFAQDRARLADMLGITLPWN